MLSNIFFLITSVCCIKPIAGRINRCARYDGWYNNLAHPDWGTPGIALTREVTAQYSDGVYKPHCTDTGFPNSRDLSEIFMNENEETTSPTGQSVFLIFFAQHVVDDIVDTRRVSCPNEYMNIRMKTSNNTETIMPVYRSKFDPTTGTSANSQRKLTNEVTSWLDGSAIYGASQSWAESLREYIKGKFRSKNSSEIFGFPTYNDNGLPLLNPTLDSSLHPKTRNPKELLSFGNPRGNENVFLMTIGVIWFRYHNYLAEKLANENPEWSDQMIFEAARRWTVGTYQKIVFYDMIPALVNNYTIPPYMGYNAFLNPGISAEFSSAAMRIGHTMIPPGVPLKRSGCAVVDPLPEEYGPSAGEPALRMCNTYWQLQDAIVKYGIEDIIRGMTSQMTKRADHVVINDLRNFLYGPMKRSRMDLEAVTIERGRDAGVASYNSVRRRFDLPTVDDFQEFTGLSNEVIDRLRVAYNNNTNMIELYVGGLLESASGRMGVGTLFSNIITDQFIRLRDSDRYWFENLDNGFFTQEEIAQLFNTSMHDVISLTTSIANNEIQRNIFLVEGAPCPSLPISTGNFTRPCTPNKGRDFFAGYWDKYAGVIVLLILFPVVTYFIMCMFAWYRQYELRKEKQRMQVTLRRKSRAKYDVESMTGVCSLFTAVEIEGQNKSRPILIRLAERVIESRNVQNSVLRRVNLSRFNKVYLLLSRNKGRNMMVIRVPKEYDMVLRFSDHDERSSAKNLLQDFLTGLGISIHTFELDEVTLIEEAVTKESRQMILETFFRKAFSEVLVIDEEPKKKKKRLIKIGKRNPISHRDEMIDCELNEEELAEILGMKKDSIFVKQMFHLADTDQSGYLSMREFADLVILLMNGSPEQKAKMIFDMYDVDNSGVITREEGKVMIRSFLELASYNMKGLDLDVAIEAIFRESGVEDDDSLTLEKFTHAMLKDHRDVFARARLSLPALQTKQMLKKTGKSQSPSSVQKVATPESANSPEEKPKNLKKRFLKLSPKSERAAVNSAALNNKEEKQAWRRCMRRFKRYVENNRRHIFCVVVFYAITLALMIERATHYAIKSEHTGLRQVTEWGLITSRATAAAISFHYTVILLTMCRNLITFCRETFLNNFIPFDSAVAFHKQIAYVAIVEVFFHVFGHIVNFYHLSVHPLPVLACIFPKLLIDDGSDMPKTFVWWLFQTVTGATGVLLLLVLSIIYIFAMQYSRRFCFRAFWMTHHLFVVVFVLVILHGSVGLIQHPLFHFYLAGPAVIYIIDKMITISRSAIEISVVKAEPLPSGVLNLVFKRPTAFDYRSGQWVRIACGSLAANEYHPFTLTSAPHEEYLSLHIRAIGPWTTNLRNLYQTAADQKCEYPTIYLDGPFGEGHQDWYKYEVSVLVGAGIGVTPFASILKDIVHKRRINQGLRIACKKVYFIWVTRTQRHFEWLTDIIKGLEDSDSENLVDTHIYITQFHHRFDLRTTMLYICERYFQKVANRSLFTGLQAITHFGRPQFEQFFESLQQIHMGTNTFGVFSCGPPGLTNGVEIATKNVNKQGSSQFIHFFENF